MNDDMIKTRHKLLFLLKNRLGQLNHPEQPFNQTNTTAKPQQPAQQENPKHEVAIDVSAPRPPQPQPAPSDIIKSDTGKDDADKPLLSKRTKEAMEVVGISVAILIAAISATQSFFNYRQAKAAERQLKEMHDEHMVDERAWVLAYDISSTIHDNDNTISFTVKFKNSGKSPALNMGAAIYYIIEPRQVPLRDNPSDAKNHGSLAADESSFISTPHIPIQIMDVIHKGGSIYVYGTIFYEDIFGRKHEGQFCWGLVANPLNPEGFIATPPDIHNKCYDETPKQKK